MTLPAGASFAHGEVKRVEEALAALAKDPHAPRELDVHVTLHVHRDFPKLVYQGKKTRSVANAAELEQATKDGFGAYDHKAFTAEED